MCNHPLIAHRSHGADFGYSRHFPMIPAKNPTRTSLS
ncbi:Hypothetical protein ACGLYG10_1650 [Actinomyces glycerinitolerans]|uniref:Uncharacterized protein n=1 Tax=Actinomyces glycerinitolerans TaxID=1892869 RepID=A0A1M4RZN1_9ACTO|nr:Hypothetical protein ACGLYG10_1650 [Actinomyces glycerinitolerans]